MLSKANNQILLIGTIIALVIAIGTLTLIRPAEIDLSANSILLSTFVILLSNVIMVYVLGTFMNLKHSKKKYYTTINIIILLVAIISSFILLTYTSSGFNVGLDTVSLMLSNLVLSLLTLVLLSVTGTIFLLRENVFYKPKTRKVAVKKTRSKKVTKKKATKR